MVPRARCTGSVYLRDTDIYGRDTDPVAVRRAVGMVFQRPNPFPTKSIADNILAGPKFTRTKLNKSERTDLVERTLRGAGLWDEVKNRLDAQAGGLSGGQQQMVAIGRALMGAPKLLLLDEPSVGIAHRLKMEIFAAIRRICDDGVAILVAEQDAQSALQIADRAYVLEHGTVAQEGVAASLQQDDRIRKIYLGVA
jgi:ABC-type branched-subunit amino acid transport system ATPase component